LADSATATKVGAPVGAVAVTDLENALAVYFKAYEDNRIEDILDWFLIPCHFVSDAEEGVTPMPLASREACRAGVQRVLDWHGELGVAGCRVTKQAIMSLSPRMSCVDVKVDVENRASAKLYDFEAIYTFVRSDEAWKVAAITHNQIPRLLACVLAARQG
jgi:hypothetical protein